MGSFLLSGRSPAKPRQAELFAHLQGMEDLGFAGGVCSISRKGVASSTSEVFEPRADAPWSITAYRLDAGTSRPALICAKQDLFS